MPTERGWAIVGTSGLYTGWWQTRAEAITGYLIGYSGGNAAHSEGISGEHRKEWERCKRRGDRCVKVKITYPAR
jgi:hypothetical protein